MWCKSSFKLWRFTCEKCVTIMRHAVVGESGLILTTWGSLTRTPCTSVFAFCLHWNPAGIWSCALRRNSAMQSHNATTVGAKVVRWRPVRRQSPCISTQPRKPASEHWPDKRWWITQRSQYVLLVLEQTMLKCSLEDWLMCGAGSFLLSP